MHSSQLSRKVLSLLSLVRGNRGALRIARKTLHSRPEGHLETGITVFPSRGEVGDLHIGGTRTLLFSTSSVAGLTTRQVGAALVLSERTALVSSPSFSSRDIVATYT